jgi:fluoroacetyl-CoA thioesterase
VLDGLIKRGDFMDFGLRNGLTARVEMLVEDKDTASGYGSGGVDVFSTPAMIALMENAARSAVDQHLPKGYITVGTRLDVSHIAATPVGMKVYAEARLIEVDGNRLTFNVQAYDRKEKIGEGRHQRCIVNVERFMQRTTAKAL